MQDEIVARLANALNAQLIIAEARRADRTPSPDSIDLYFQGMSAYNRDSTPDRLSEVACVVRAGSCPRSRQRRCDCRRRSHGKRLRQVAHRAMTGLLVWRRPKRSRSRRCRSRRKSAGTPVLGIVRIYTNRVAQGIAELERALAIDRNLADAHAYIGIAKCFVGRAEETDIHVHEALRLSPRDTFAYLWRTIWASQRSFSARTKTRSRSCGRRSRSTAVSTRAFLPRGRTGGPRTARRSPRRGEGRAFHRPHFTIRRYRADAPSDNPVFLAGRERVYEMMRVVGVPEG